MSTADYQGSAYAFQRLMQAVREEIDRGERHGARVIHATADPRKTKLLQRSAAWWRQRIRRQTA